MICSTLECYRTIWLCRHGNRQDFVDPGWTGDDPPLSEDGDVQARETAARLANESIDHVFTSPFLRTVQTASHIASALEKPAKVESGIAEWYNPEWFADCPQLDLHVDGPGQWRCIDDSYCSQMTPNYPETMDEAMERCQQAFQRLLELFDGNLLFVGHGLTVTAMSRYLVGDLEVWPGLCSIVRIDIAGGEPTLVLNGDTSHLGVGRLHADRFN